MAESVYDIAGGDTQIELSGVNRLNELVGAQVNQVVGDVLDGNITLKLVQSEDGLEFHPLPERPILMEAADLSVLLQSCSFAASRLYLDIEVGTATSGSIQFSIFSK